MRSLQVVDTFPAFEDFWERARGLPVDRQVALWERDYMAPWPELLAKQKEDYAVQGFDWHKVARTRIFPHMEERLERMRRLHGGLVRALPTSWSLARAKLGLRVPVQFVIHVGIGCGMGWGTRLGGRPTILFGLENAADRQGRRGDLWSGVIVHEVAHVAHDEWRRERGLDGEEDGRGRPHPLWQLYVEGFATQVEREVVGRRAFRWRTGDLRWLPWCEGHRRWLARKFLEDAKARRSVRPFFGSWYRIQGQVQTGYWLGAEVVREWRRVMTFQDCAVVPEVVARRMARRTLREMAAARASPEGGWTRRGSAVGRSHRPRRASDLPPT